MNEIEFRQRAYANPLDDSEEFLAAVQENSERQGIVTELQAFNAALTNTLLDVPVSIELKQSLLDPESLAGVHQPLSAANDGRFWKIAVPIAASFMLALGLFFNFADTSADELEQKVLAHIYMEINFLEMNENLSISSVNNLLELSQVQLAESGDLDSLEVLMASDCLIDRENALHMVVKGDMGAVTVMLIPNAPVQNEFSISDDRFEGWVTPTANGNLIIVGEKNEPLDRYALMLAGNINW